MRVVRVAQVGDAAHVDGGARPSELFAIQSRGKGSHERKVPPSAVPKGGDVAGLGPEFSSMAVQVAEERLKIFNRRRIQIQGR